MIAAGLVWVTDNSSAAFLLGLSAVVALWQINSTLEK
jgi:hypothetical protein